MSYRTLSPFESMLNLRNTMDQLFERSFAQPEFGLGASTASLMQLPLNIYEADDALHVEALLPGISQEDVTVSIDRGVLTIGAKRHGPAQEGKRWHLSEFGAGEFTRGISLPYPVDADRVTAQFTNGVLTLTLPKAESAKPRQIQIGGGQTVVEGQQAQIGSGKKQK
jgi:HSP20 family protein